MPCPAAGNASQALIPAGESQHHPHFKREESSQPFQVGLEVQGNSLLGKPRCGTQGVPIGWPGWRNDCVCHNTVRAHCAASLERAAAVQRVWRWFPRWLTALLNSFVSHFLRQSTPLHVGLLEAEIITIRLCCPPCRPCKACAALDEEEDFTLGSNPRGDQPSCLGPAANPPPLLIQALRHFMPGRQWSAPKGLLKSERCRSCPVITCHGLVGLKMH